MIVCWGELLWDMFPGGACLGGAPSNVAVHLAALGSHVSLITRLGNDTLGEQAHQELKARGVGVSGLQVDTVEPTGQVKVLVDDMGEASYSLQPGAWQKLLCDKRAQELLTNAQVFSFGTLSQESVQGLQSWREALDALPPHAIHVCDPNLRGPRINTPLLREHMQVANIVKINDHEATTLERAMPCDDAVQWLLHEMSVDLVALTHGDKGATLVSKQDRVTHTGFSSGLEGDNVGAGDSFTAVLIRDSAIAPTAQSLAVTLSAANRYAAFVASKVGATPLPEADLLDIVR